jgi:hypothetical protein
MKREEREYAEVVPEATRKARLEQQANTLLDLPKDVRKMIMIQMDPIDMYALYSGVDNYAFKKWCDQHFWDYALRTRYPYVRAQQHMVHPRWRFFAYTLTQLDALDDSRLNDLEFERLNDNRQTLSIVSIREVRWPQDGKQLSIQFRPNNVIVGQFALQLFVGSNNEIPDIMTNYDGYRNIQITLDQLPPIFYRLFELGYKLRIWHNETYHLLGCHLCGSPAVTGYSAEDPSKLLCGPTCTALKK